LNGRNMVGFLDKTVVSRVRMSSWSFLDLCSMGVVKCCRKTNRWRFKRMGAIGTRKTKVVGTFVGGKRKF
jgi:hypothetical protein